LRGAHFFPLFDPPDQVSGSGERIRRSLRLRFRHSQTEIDPPDRFLPLRVTI
jgi:hypothetical protein